VIHLGLTGDVPELQHDVVVHGDPMMMLRPAGRGPGGTTAWTVLVLGQLLEDIDLALWRHGIKLRPEQILSSHRRSPAALVGQWQGSPNGVAWRGRGTVQHRIGPGTPYPNVHAAGAASVSGDGLPFVGLSAALVAAAIGPA
jgi:UDP-galactopyranose mutase